MFFGRPNVGQPLRKIAHLSLDFARAHVHFLFPMSQVPLNSDAQLYALGLIERLHVQCRELWGASSDAYFRVDALLRELANPNLHDIPTRLPFRVEMWDRSSHHIRWVIAASSSIAIGHAALDAAIANYPNEHFTLRNGILVIRESGPK